MNRGFLLAALTRATCAAFIKESRMKFPEANEVDRKPGLNPGVRRWGEYGRSGFPVDPGGIANSTRLSLQKGAYAAVSRAA
jgi:hypothetical protein